MSANAQTIPSPPLSPRIRLETCNPDSRASKATRENVVKPPNCASSIIVSIGNQSPMLHRLSMPESLIVAEISVMPRNPDARFTPDSPILELTMNRRTDAIPR